jgi:hypothetical protein
MSVELVAAHATPRAEKRYAFLGFPSSKGKVDRIVKDVRSSAYAYLSAARQQMFTRDSGSMKRATSSCPLRNAMWSHSTALR